MADRDGSTLLWFLAGLGVGALVGVLYAPKAGDEMRDTIRSKAQEAPIALASRLAGRASRHPNGSTAAAMPSTSKRSRSAPPMRPDVRPTMRRPPLPLPQASRPRISNTNLSRSSLWMTRG